MRLSRKDGGCIDYIQFGKDDNIPWYTLEKSKKICGVKDGKTNSSRGVFFEEEDGNLLIWIALGGRRSTSHWNGISEVSLTLVVTAYQKCKGNDGKRRKCGNTDACILQDYFCDRRFNCPPDKFTSIDIGVDKHRTFDERGCNYQNLGLEDTTMSPDDLSNDGSGAFGDLNLVSLTLIIICLLCVPLILCLAVLQIRKVYSTNRSCCHCFGSNMSERTSCELPEGGPQSLVQLSSQRQRRPNDSEQNVYLPLTTFLDQPISPPATFATNESSQPDVLITNENSSRQVRQFTPDFPEEPPPAYNDLFPEGFQQLNESQEILNTEVSSNSPQLLANETSNEASADVIDSIQLERVNQDVQQLQNDSLAETSNLGASSSSNTSVNQQLAILPGSATSEANIVHQQVNVKLEERA